MSSFKKLTVPPTVFLRQDVGKELPVSPAACALHGEPCLLFMRLVKSMRLAACEAASLPGVMSLGEGESFPTLLTIKECVVDI